MLWSREHWQSRFDHDSATTWCDLAQAVLSWSRPPVTAWTGSWSAGEALRWFPDGVFDPLEALLDRWTRATPEAAALHYLRDGADIAETWSYARLHDTVERTAGALAGLGIGPGDRVGICLPNIPEAAVALLACARLGAVHGVVFAGFGHEALAERWLDLGCRVVLVADAVVRGGRTIDLREPARQAVAQCPAIRHIVAVQRSATALPEGWIAWAPWVEQAPPPPARWQRPGDVPLFVLHTSGSTGKPKGLLHGTAGFLLHAALTHRWSLDLRAEDRYACLADLGWITGHAYVLYGPLLNGCPIVLDEGTPLYPDANRYGRIASNLGLTAMFTVPTVLRLLRAAGAAPLPFVRIVACAGEILDEPTRYWVATTYTPTGQMVNIYGQTEAAGHLLAADPTLASVAVLPFPGMAAAVDGTEAGPLVITTPWPGMAAQVRARTLPGGVVGYVTGDLARTTEKGFHIEGRADDALSLAGHRLTAAEIENVVLALGAAEAVAVGIPDAIRGQALVVVVVPGNAWNPAVLRQGLRERLGAFVTPQALVPVPALPRTRSGKPLRRAVAAILTGRDPGDLTTLADPTAMDALVEAVRTRAGDWSSPR